MKKIVVISSSLRSGSNSEILAKEFVEGAKDAGNSVEFISLKNKDIKFCIGCLSCLKNHKCILHDDMEDLLKSLVKADVICFASPIYYYEMSGQLKTFLDRCNPLFDTDFKFKEIYLLATCADSSDCMDRMISGVEGWIECFDGFSLKGTYLLKETNEPNEAFKKEGLSEAYKLGNSIK